MKNVNKCKCGGIKLLAENGEMVCNKCGTVLEEKTSDNVDDGLYLPPVKKQLADSELSSMMDRDVSGREISSEQKLKSLNHLRKLDAITKITAANRKYKQVDTDLNKVVEKLNIPNNISDRTINNYKKLESLYITKGKMMPAFILSVLYFTCREMEMPMTINDIAITGNVSKSHIKKYYKVIVSALDIEMSVSDPSKYVNKIASLCNPPIPKKTINLALRGISNLQKNGVITGRDPISMAATALYAASLKNKDKGITQKNIALAAGITKATIGNRYNEFVTAMFLP